MSVRSGLVNNDMVGIYLQSRKNEVFLGWHAYALTVLPVPVHIVHGVKPLIRRTSGSHYHRPNPLTVVSKVMTIPTCSGHGNITELGLIERMAAEVRTVINDFDRVLTQAHQIMDDSQ
jgi:hypothetical protein